MKIFRWSYACLIIFTLFFLQQTESSFAQTLTARPNVSMAPNTNGYYEYLPFGYNSQGSQKYPLLIAFGGLSQNGNGTLAELDYVFSNWGGPGWQIKNGKFPSSFTVNGQLFRYIVILPQFSSGASPANVDQVITYLLAHYQADPNRVYITGNSKGGGYCWDYPGASTQYSQRIAATIPTCAAASYSVSKAQNIAATNLPVWATHNAVDAIVSPATTKAFVNGINGLPNPPTPRARMTIFQDVGHNCADSTFNTVYGVHTSNGLNIYEWLLTNSRSTACNSPAGLTTSSITSTSANITWSSATGANSYDVEYKATSSSTWKSIVSGSTTTSASLSGLAASTSYDWRVRSNCSSGSSSFSSTQFTTLAPSACNAPAGLTTSSITSTSANISWSSATGANSYDVEYKATSSSTWISLVSGTTSTSRSLSGLVASISYDWRVRSNCSSGSSSFSSTQFTTLAPAVCNSPAGLTTSSITTSSANISWSSATGANSYDVEYKATSSSTWISRVSGTNATTSNLTGLVASTSYDWRVRSNCSSGSSSFGSTQFTTSAPPACNAPTGLTTSSITISSANISWSSATGASSYNVEYKATSASTWISVATGTTTTSASLSGLASSTSYDWRVRSNCSSGSSSFSSIQFTTVPATACTSPTGLSASASPTTGIVSWNSVSGGNSYDVDYKATSSSTWINAASAITGIYSILGNLAYSTSYDWRVRTICTAGNSAYSTGQFSTAAASGCIDPTGLVSSVTTNSAILSWNAASGSSSYKVEYRRTNSRTWVTAVSSTTATTITLSGLTVATAFDWRVRSFCAVGSSGYSLGQLTTLSANGCSDQFEPNNIYATAADVNTGVNINAQISSSGDDDYYRFNNIAGQSKIKITLTNLPFDYDLQLFNKVGLVIRTSQNPGTMDESVILNTSNIGSYVARVYSNSGAFSSSQCYTVNIQIGNVAFSAVHPSYPASTLIDETAATVRGGLKVYPVPASSSLTASFDAYRKGTADLIIINRLGQQVMRKTVGVDDGSNTTKLDVSKLTAGMYFLKVINGKEVQMKKLIIER